MIIDKADLVVLGGKIYQPTFRGNTALAVRDGMIWAVGQDREILSLVDREKTLVVDLQGGSLLPGLIDGHCHFSGFVRSRRELNLDPHSSRKKIQKEVAKKAQILPPGTWILGRGWNRNHWEDSSFPKAVELDPVSPHHPVALNSRDGHALWLNSLALEKLSITATTPCPPGGDILRDSRGTPLGILTENALDLFYKGRKRESITPTEGQSALDYLYSIGITGFHTLERKEELLFLQTLKREGILKGRVRFSLPRGSLDSAIEMGLQSGFGDSLLFSGVKLFSDGALGSRTAYMKEPYKETSEKGMMVRSYLEILEILKKAIPAGIAVMTHAIGDGAVEIMVRAMEKAQNLYQSPFPLLHRIEHAQHITGEIQKKMGLLKLVASMQPGHLIGDWENIRRFLPDRQHRAYPFASLRGGGSILSFGSDMPIESPHPFRGIYAACTRDQFLEGKENLSRDQALLAYTLHSARSFGERDLGALEAGYQADLVGLKEDFSAIPLEDFPQIMPLFTVVRGEMIHRT